MKNLNIKIIKNEIFKNPFFVFAIILGFQLKVIIIPLNVKKILIIKVKNIIIKENATNWILFAFLQKNEFLSFLSNKRKIIIKIISDLNKEIVSRKFIRKLARFQFLDNKTTLVSKDEIKKD